MLWLIAAAVLLFMAGAALMLWPLWRRSQEYSRVEGRLLGSARHAGELEEGRFGAHTLWRRLASGHGGGPSLMRDPVLARRLRQLGLRRAGDRAAVALVVQALPWVVVGGGLAISWISRGALTGEDIGLVAVLGLAALLLPKRVVGGLASARQMRIGEQVTTAVQILRMLLDSGQSVQHALGMVAVEGRDLMPDLSREIDLALNRARSGEGLVVVLDGLARDLEVPELDDTVLILKQVLEQGGNVDEPLTRLAALINDRQRTRVQEKVSKMSAKMSVVMMLFLFPALLVVLAAPGLIGLITALGGVGG